MEMNERELKEEWESKYDFETGRLREGMVLSSECYNWMFKKIMQEIDKGNWCIEAQERMDIFLGRQI